MILGSSIIPILVLFVKLFFLVFVIGLVGGLVYIIKNYVLTPKDIDTIKGTFSFKK